MDGFLNTTPVIPTILIVMSSIAYVPAIILVYVATKAPLHANCRFLLIGWVFGLCAMFSTMISIRRYQSSTIAKRNLLGATVFIVVMTSIQFSIQHAGYYTACGLMMQGADLSTVIVNSIAVRYCKRRHLNLQGWLSLNARYQIKEAYEMSRSMQPVLVTVLFFKFIIIISTDIVFYTSAFGNYAVGYNEAVYLFVTAIYGNCVTIMLMRTHPALKKQAVKILCKPVEADTSLVVPAAETETHFEYLRNEWLL